MLPQSEQERLYVVTRRDLPTEAQAVQCCHATAEFMLTKPGIWLNNTIVLLSVEDEGKLKHTLDKARVLGIDAQEFFEPDLGNAMTAFAAAGDDAKRFFRNFRMLKERKSTNGTG